MSRIFEVVAAVLGVDLGQAMFLAGVLVVAPFALLGGLELAKKVSVAEGLLICLVLSLLFMAAMSMRFGPFWQDAAFWSAGR